MDANAIQLMYNNCPCVILSTRDYNGRSYANIRYVKNGKHCRIDGVLIKEITELE